MLICICLWKISGTECPHWWNKKNNKFTRPMSGEFLSSHGSNKLVFLKLCRNTFYILGAIHRFQRCIFLLSDNSELHMNLNGEQYKDYKIVLQKPTNQIDHEVFKFIWDSTLSTWLTFLSELKNSCLPLNLWDPSARLHSSNGSHSLCLHHLSHQKFTEDQQCGHNELSSYSFSMH